VLLDNFYVDAEVSADGHEWSMGAYATDFVEKLWPLEYGHDKRGKFVYPAEGVFPRHCHAGGAAICGIERRRLGVSYRSYGEFITDAKDPNGVAVARLKALQGHIDEFYRGFDLNYSDQRRADRFIAEFETL